MAEEEKISEILINGTTYKFKEEQNKDMIERVKQDIEAGDKSEGAYEITEEFMGLVKSVVVNTGKEEVTDADRKIREIERQNELLKTSMDDLRTQNEEIQKAMNVIPAKKVDPPAEPAKGEDGATKTDPPKEPPKADDKDPDGATKTDPPKDPKDGDGTGGSE